VREAIADFMLIRGTPERIRSGNGAEMAAKIVRRGLARLAAKTIYIETGHS